MADCNLLPKLNIVQVSAGTPVLCPSLCPGFSMLLTPQSHLSPGTCSNPPAPLPSPVLPPVPPAPHAQNGACPQISLPSTSPARCHPSSYAVPEMSPLQCQECLLAPCHPSSLAPAHKYHCPATGCSLAQLRAGQRVTPFLPAGRVPALPPLRDPQGPGGRVALPQCCQRNQGVQVHLPQQRGNHPSLSLRGPVTAVSRAHTQVRAGPGLGSSPAPAPILPQPPESCLHALGRAESMSCAPGTQIPPAGTPAEVPAAICTALSLQTNPRLLCHPP